jgi:hypothetical protein
MNILSPNVSPIEPYPHTYQTYGKSSRPKHKDLGKVIVSLSQTGGCPEKVLKFVGAKVGKKDSSEIGEISWGAGGIFIKSEFEEIGRAV